MDKVVVITGASSGIGKETAKLFQAKNWKVAATMRKPEDSADLQRIADIECFRLDVTDPSTIQNAIDDVLEKFGRIDVVVNNAGYGLIGPFEAATPEQIERQMNTNLYGVMNVCRAILPYFREQRRGYIVNVSSVSGLMTFPLSSLYHASKWAVEGFSESLHYDLDQFDIRVKLIDPGPIKSDFFERSLDVAKTDGLTVYDDLMNRFLPNMKKGTESAPDGSVVAQVIYDAVTDKSRRLRYGANTKGILRLRRALPDRLFLALIRKLVLK